MEPPKKKHLNKQICTCSTEIMEHHIWKDFPEDLLEAVIARLPIAAFIRFRSVCKKWNSMLTPQRFSEYCAQLPPKQPWVYTVSNGNVNTGAMYDPEMKKWHHSIIYTLPAIPTKLKVLPVASAGGLVCFVDIRQRSFYVGNPLTMSFKKLPARSINVGLRGAVGMMPNGKLACEGYKIIWVSCDGEYEVYNSRENSWTPGSVSPNIPLPLSLNFKSQTVSSGSMLYFMRSNPDGIVSCDMATGVWKQFIIPAPLHLSDHTLAEYGGHIMLVGLLTKNTARCVCIWELQKMTLLWKEVARVSLNVRCLEFYRKRIRMACLCNKNMFIMSLSAGQMNRLITYDFSTREWDKVPGCILPPGNKEQWLTNGTSFNPCLTCIG